MPMGDNLRKRAGRSWSRLEALLALGTGAAAEPIAGIAGLAGLLGGLDRGVRNIDATRQALTYQPRDPRGMQELGQALAPIVEPYERAKNYMGDGVLEATGSPGLATAAYTAPDALAALVGLRTGGMKGPTMQQMAERSAGPGMGQPASQVGAIGAWHGSPHDFDRFSMDRIGTGEGAQAYGHGLYFAGNRGVAEGYRKALSDTVNARTDLTPLEKRAAQMAITFSDGTSQGAVNWLSKFREKGANHVSPAMTPELVESLMKKFDSGDIAPGGRTYNVELTPDETDLLDWDAPLSQQPEKVRAAFEAWKQTPQGRRVAADGISFEKGRLGGELTGEDIHTLLYEGYASRQGGEAAKVSGYLREAGIPGIRYLDGQSRGAGEGSRNYVIFDDTLVQIKGKE